MILYLLRHAIAVPRGTTAYPNDDRPLTKEGIDKMMKGAKGMSRVIEEVDMILTSPLSRAKETARIAADVLRAKDKVDVCQELAPGSSVKDLLAYLAKHKNLSHVLLVGHEPDLGYLASSLLGSTSSIIEFKKGALCCLEVPQLPTRRPATLLWHLTPKQLRQLAS
jgi:phosphohistidine phosphatase